MRGRSAAMLHQSIVPLLVLLIVVVAAAYVTAALHTDAELAVAPLDDAYISFQYARQIAHGQWLRYNDGEPPTSGLTSLLYGLLLAGIYLLVGDPNLPGAAVALGVLWLPLIGWLTWRLAVRLLPSAEGTPWALAAAGLTLLTGALQWACFNGMETGLMTVLVLATLNALIRDRPGYAALWAGLAALTRPDGLVLVGVLWCIALIRAWRARERRIAVQSIGLFSLSAVAGLLPTVFIWALTGEPSSTGLQSKSWFANVPAYPDAIARNILDGCRRLLVERYLGWGTPERWFLVPGVLLLALIGWGHLGRRRAWAALAATLGWVVLGSVFTATAMTTFWHLGRYQIPLVPVFVIAAVCGLAALAGWRRIGRWVALGLTGVLLTLTLFTAWSYARIYRDALATVVHQHVAVGRWLRAHTPPDTLVGVNDVGIIRYISERPTYDLAGLTTQHAAPAWRNGPGSVLEGIEDWPRLPDYMAIYPDRFALPNLADTDPSGQALYCATVEDPVVASVGTSQCVWRADWSAAQRAGHPQQPDILARTEGLTLVDALDMADLQNEAAHGLLWWNQVRRPGYATEAQQLAYHVGPAEEVLDGGRLVTGGMTFSLRSDAGRPLVLVARLHAREQGAMRVTTDGVDLGRWAYPALPGEWLETLFVVPATSVTGAKTEVTLRAEPDVPGFQHLAIYHLWAFQGDAQAEPITPGISVDARFGADISLVGLDLPKQSWRPGDTLSVTLYWRTAAGTASDDRVFLHLYNAAGTLRAQLDGWAYHDTRPPYTWMPGEMVSDPRQLYVPPDLPAGRYTLEAGLYDLVDGARLPAVQRGAAQPEGRVTLAEITLTP